MDSPLARLAARVDLRARLPTRALVLSTALIAAAAQAEGEPAAQPSTLRLSGYNKTFLIDSSTVGAAPQDYRLLLNRTRLKANWRPLAGVELHAENDTEWRQGNYLLTAQSQAEEAAPRRKQWDLHSSVAQGDRWRLDNDFFRLFAHASYGESDLSIGRQRIALGTGRLWSTLDTLNPLNPLQIERDEYVGVDALLAEHKLGELSRLSLAVAPQPGGGPTRWVAAGHTHLASADLGVMAARNWGDDVLGADLATQWGGLGVRGELSLTRPAIGRRHEAAVLGLDYAFENTLTLSFETYASNQPGAERLRQFQLQPARLDTQPFGKRYAGLIASYEFTPLLKATVMGLSNRQDGSRFTSFTLAWSLTDGLMLQGGLQRFGGGAASEFGRGRPLAYLQLQWFFQGDRR